MKSNLFSLFFIILLIGLYSCTDDNYDLYSEEELEQEPVIIDVENALSFRLGTSSSTTNTTGVAYKKRGNYLIGSRDVDVDCSGSGIGFSFDGGEYFSFLFYADEFSTQVLTAGFETEIDGELTGVSNTITPPNCQGERIEVTFEETEDRISGTFTGEFFILADSLVSPFDSCVNFVSVGILEASFDVELIDCE